MKWEDICSRCGLCCHEKVIYPDALVIDLSMPCEFYDSDNSGCSVYHERFSCCSRCEKVTPLKAMFSRSLPDSCSYVQWAKRHHIRFRRPSELIINTQLDSTS